MINNMPFTIRIILFAEVMILCFSLLTVLNLIPSSLILNLQAKLMILLSAMPSLIAICMIINRSQRAVAAIIVSWFSVNLFPVVIWSGPYTESNIHLVIGFTSILGLGLFVYLKSSRPIKFYLIR